MICMCPEISSKLISDCSGLKRKSKLFYHPSNSKKGIAIKGTNLRVSIFIYY